jgi:hypothetical protein
MNHIETKRCRYDNFKKLAELTSLKDYCDGENVEFHKMIRTGDLEFHDYGAGFINFEIFLTKQGDKYFVRIWLATPDDGDMGGWKECWGKEDGEILIRRFVREYLENLIEFPTLEVLNEEIRKYGFYICHE